MLFFIWTHFLLRVEFSKLINDSSNYFCGVVKSNRKFLPTQINKKDSMKFFSHGDLYFHYWKDKREIRILSNFYANYYVREYKYDKKQKKEILKQIPASIYQYNIYAKGVDKNNQLVSYHLANRKTIKWYKKVFFYFIEISLVNSFLIYKHNCSDLKMSLLEYKIEIIKNLIGKDLLEEDVFTNDQHRLKGKHFLEKGQNSLDCVVCSTTNNRVRVIYRCKICKVNICPIECFEKYHTKISYK
jgi:hypothetical protein